MAPQSPPVLSYGRKPAKVGRKVLLVALLSALLVLAICFAPRAWQRAEDWMTRRRYLAAQTEAMNRNLPAERVVLTDDPASVGPGMMRATGTTTSLLPDADMAQLSLLFAQTGGRDTLEASSQIGLVFIHDRTSPAGHHRLVYIGALGGSSLLWQVIVPGTGSTRPTAADARILDLWHTTQPLTIYAGQADPADASRASIGFAVHGNAGTIDFYLQDDDTLLINPHNGITPLPAGVQVNGFFVDGLAAHQVHLMPLFRESHNDLGDAETSMPLHPAAAFSPDDRILAVGDSSKKNVQLLDASTGKPIRTLEGPVNWQLPGALEFSSDGKWLLSRTIERNQGNKVTNDFWEVATGQRVAPESIDPAVRGGFVLSNTPGAPNVTSITLPDGKARPVFDDPARHPAPWFFRANWSGLVVHAGSGGPGILSYAFSPDGKLLTYCEGGASVVQDKTGVRIMDIATHDLLLTRFAKWNPGVGTDPIASQSYVFSAFSPDGRFLAATADAWGMYLWNMPKCDVEYDLTDGEPIEAFAFSPSGKRIATMSMTQTLSVWDLEKLP